MAKNLIVGVPVICAKKPKKNTVLFMVVGGHTSGNGELIEISRMSLNDAIKKLIEVCHSSNLNEINSAINDRNINSKVIEKIIKQLSSGLDMHIRLKGPGKSDEDKLNNFAINILDIWKQMNEISKKNNKEKYGDIINYFDEKNTTSKQKVSTINMEKSRISLLEDEAYYKIEINSSGTIQYQSHDMTRCEACGKPENYCICSN